MAAPRRAGEICVGTIDSWVLWNLTGGRSFATDATNASRTQLLDLDRLHWDDELLDPFGIPAAALADVRRRAAGSGRPGGLGWLPAGRPSPRSSATRTRRLFGHGAPEPGSVKATYGTGSSLMAPSTAGADAQGSRRPSPGRGLRVTASASSSMRWKATSLPRAPRSTGSRRSSASTGHPEPGLEHSRRQWRTRTASTSCPPSRASARPTGTPTPAGSSAGPTRGTHVGAPRPGRLRGHRLPGS